MKNNARHLALLSIRPRLPDRRGLVAAGSMAALLFNLAGWAQPAPKDQPAPDQAPQGPAVQPKTNAQRSLSRHTERFLEQAHETLFRIQQVSQLGTGRATDPRVKAFAGSVLDFQQQLTRELRSLVTTRQVNLAEPDPDPEWVKELSEHTGPDFDREIVARIGELTTEARKIFGDAASSVEDKELRDYAARHADRLAEHSGKAEELKALLKGN